MRESRHWGEFPAVLRSHIPGAEIVALDQPGNGRLYRSSSPLRIEDMAESDRRELSLRGCAPPYYLVGLSMGAMVAVAWGARHPEELRGCVLINSSFGRYDPFYRRLRPRAYPSLPALIAGNAAQRERAILRLTSCRGDAQAEVLESWIAYQRECPVSRRNALRQLIAAARFRAPALRPAMPVLVLASARDGLVNSSCSRELAARWNTAFAIHSDAGHDLPLDDAAWVAARVRDWHAAGG